ncbi:ferritin family protein [Dehalogenimonas sp. THU2]|uniref:ferritin family protein n=1 Tax=Dehalogenimonas sp. THU2 TaxID=3151121 RepID=UPI0032183EC6
MDITDEQEKLLEAINLAMEMESEAKECYLVASEGSNNEAGRKLLLSLAEEEDGHRRRFEEFYESITKGHGWPSSGPEKRGVHDIRNNLIETCRELGVTVNGSSSEVEALQLAIDKERKSYEFYKDHSDKAAYTTEKELFGSIANEEWEHELALLDYKEYLSDPAGWFVEKEHPSLDGG